MSVTLIIFLTTLIAGLFCVGGFLWSAMEGRPQKIWLIGAAVTVLMGLAGLVMPR